MASLVRFSPAEHFFFRQQLCRRQHHCPALIIRVLVVCAATALLVLFSQIAPLEQFHKLKRIAMSVPRLSASSLSTDRHPSSPSAPTRIRRPTSRSPYQLTFLLCKITALQISRLHVLSSSNSQWAHQEREILEIVAMLALATIATVQRCHPLVTTTNVRA